MRGDPSEAAGGGLLPSCARCCVSSGTMANAQRRQPLLDRATATSITSPSWGAWCCSYFCSVRAAIVWTLALCVATQTALRSVPSLVFNGDDGMAAELGYSNSQRGAVLSSFGWAYTATQIPGGYLSQVIGPKRTLGFSVALGAVAGLLMPIGAHFSFVGPLALNAVIGLSQGPVFPVIKGVMAQWLRPEELARGNAFMVSCSERLLARCTARCRDCVPVDCPKSLSRSPPVYRIFSSFDPQVAAPWYGGMVLQFLLSPRLLSSHGCDVRIPCIGPIPGWQLVIPGGWRLAWYVYAPFGLLWCLLWWRTGADSPRTHPRIRPETLEYLSEGGGKRPSPDTAGAVDQEGKDQDGFGVAVMVRVCRAKPVALTTVCLILDGAGLAYANWLPQYYSTQLDFDLGDTGIVVALPLLVGLVASLLGGLCADFVLTRAPGASVTTVRRCFNVIPTVLMAVCTLMMMVRDGHYVQTTGSSSESESAHVGASRRDQMLAVGLQMILSGLNGFKHAGISPVGKTLPLSCVSSVRG